MRMVARSCSCIGAEPAAMLKTMLSTGSKVANSSLVGAAPAIKCHWPRWGSGNCVYACVMRRTQTQYGPLGDGGGGSSGCSAPSHLGRAPARLALRNSLFGAVDFLVVPHESEAWGPEGSRKFRLAISKYYRGTEVAVGGRLERAVSHGAQ